MTRPTREAALERIRAALSDRLAVPLADITAESLLIDELGADSLDFVDLMFVFEKEFGVKILEDELASLAKMEGAIPPEVVEKVRGWVPDLVIHPDTPLTAATLFRRLTVESLWRMISERLPAPTA
jgi:acyl carrier protein